MNATGSPLSVPDRLSTGRFTRSFSKRGRYSYVCTIHVALGMRGSVVVK